MKYLHLDRVSWFPCIAMVLVASAGPAFGELMTVETATILEPADVKEAVGIPQNNGAFWDGSQYWLMYAQNGELQAKHGSSLAALSDSPTSPTGSSNVTGLENDKTFSVVYGRHQGEWHAWALANRTPAGEPWSLYRWRLSSNGLTNGQAVSVNLSSKSDPSHVTLNPGRHSFDIDELFGTVSSYNRGSQTSDIANRRIAADLTGDTGLGGVVMSGVRFPEAAAVFQLDDGSDGDAYVLNAINVGDFGSPAPPRDSAFSEWSRSSLAGGWSSESQLESTGAGNWSDLSYSQGQFNSHAGQTDFVQLADGSIFNAYVTAGDPVNGYFGDVVLKQRGQSLSDDWSTASIDAAGDRVWHLALTSDGAIVYLLYVKDDGSGVRDDAICLRAFDPESDVFSDELAIARISEGYRFERMTTQWRFTDDRLVVLWSETNDGTNFRVNATAVSIPEPASLALLSIGIAALGIRRNSRQRL